MQRPLQITFHGFEHSEALAQRIREEAQKLSRFEDQVIGCHVTVEAPRRHRQQGELYEIKVVVSLPHREVLVRHEGHIHHGHDDAYSAVGDAFAIVMRQLEEHAARTREERRRQA